jgi:hypothetical protein
MESLKNVLSETGVEFSNVTLNKEKQVEAIKKQLFTVSKYEVNEPRPNFEKPDCVTIYDDGGRYLGQAKKTYGILQPEHYFNSIISGLENEKSGFDFSKKIEYREINNGRVIEFKIPIKKINLNKYADRRDIVETFMLCTTSFDGTQSTRSAVLTQRLICTNGMVLNEKHAYNAFRHTDNMNIKALAVTEAMAKSLTPIVEFKEFAEKLSEIKLTQSDRNRIIERITGYSVKDYAKLHRAKQNILDGINNGLVFEKNNMGVNNTAWSLFNAFTYHTNHDLDGSLVDTKNITLTVGAGTKLNNKVQKEFKAMFA